ncbi:MAG: serine/threonine protein kinase [Gemmatimonadaceae bacterium]|nr:serine/threonine protein kinase [Gemmatimonadaceae bacterium]
MITRAAFGEQIARRLGERFHDARLLHAGENGLVFSARDPAAHGERRAVRVPYPNEGTDAGHAIRFRRLVALAQAVSHPHIARVHTTELIDGLEVAVTELAGPLRVDHLIVATRPPTVHRILTVLREIGEALDLLHAAGIVHGALRPSRVLLDASGHVKLTGMLLRAGETPPHPALRPAAVGDPAYMAPEQWHAEMATPAMDRYAVGVMAYELYTAEPRVTHLDASVAVHPLQIPLQRPLRPDVPLAVNEVLRRATHADPGMRYASVRELVDALERPHTPVSAHAVAAPAPEAGSASRISPRMWGLIVALIAALLLLLT